MAKAKSKPTPKRRASFAHEAVEKTTRGPAASPPAAGERGKPNLSDLFQGRLVSRVPTDMWAQMSLGLAQGSAEANGINSQIQQLRNFLQRVTDHSPSGFVDIRSSLEEIQSGSTEAPSYQRILEISTEMPEEPSDDGMRGSSAISDAKFAAVSSTPTQSTTAGASQDDDELDFMSEDEEEGEGAGASTKMKKGQLRRKSFVHPMRTADFHIPCQGFHKVVKGIIRMIEEEQEDEDTYGKPGTTRLGRETSKVLQEGVEQWWMEYCEDLARKEAEESLKREAKKEKRRKSQTAAGRTSSKAGQGPASEGPDAPGSAAA
ncbi:unnamed protein product [Amoebophrya sp. A25]|nr:unnamed protein product [Amoebophrya sp. A25]|eukprot:GSA25T00015855001.1